MSPRPFAACLAALLWLTLSFTALAEEPADARAFVQRENTHIAAILKQPRSPSRDAQLQAAIGAMLDHTEIARRALEGATLSDAQRAEVTDLLRRVIDRRYSRKVALADGLTITYKGPKPVDAQRWRVRVEVRSQVQRREPPIVIDYIVRQVGGAFKVVDILTEGASLAQSYRDQIEKVLATPNEGYARLVQLLTESASAVAAL